MKPLTEQLKKTLEWLKKIPERLKKIPERLKKIPEQLKDSPKRFVRSITKRKRRCHKRKLFFKSVFEQLREGELKEPIGSFTGIKGDDSWFDTCCHNMAGYYPFYPFDKKCEINAGNFFSSDDHPQSYESLMVIIKRKSTILWMILSHSGVNNVHVNVTGSGFQSDFSYEVKYSSRKRNSRWG